MRRFRGLLSNEDGTVKNEKFAKYFAIVDQKAKERNCIFFISEDLWGWLIPEDRADEFEKLWAEDKESDDWIDFFLCAEWRKKADGYDVEFVNYPA